MGPDLHEWTSSSWPKIVGPSTQGLNGGAERAGGASASLGSGRARVWAFQAGAPRWTPSSSGVGAPASTGVVQSSKGSTVHGREGAAITTVLSRCGNENPGAPRQRGSR
jgi:hypothetical protein